MAFKPVVPFYIDLDLAIGEIQKVANKVYELAKKINQGRDVIIRGLNASDINAVGTLVLTASGLNTVSIASGTVSTGTVIGLYGVTGGSGSTSASTSAGFYYLDIYVGGRRVQRWDLTYLNAESNFAWGLKPWIFMPYEYSVIMQQGQTYNIQVVYYNNGWVFEMDVLGFIAEPLGRTVYPQRY